MNKKPNIIFRHTISPEVHVAAWASADGVSFSIQKSYWSRKDGAWRKTNSFFAKDLAALLLLCQEALSYNNQFWRNLTPEQREERRRLRGSKSNEAEESQYNYDTGPSEEESSEGQDDDIF